MVSRLTLLLAPIALAGLLGGCVAPNTGGSAAGASNTSGPSNAASTTYTPMPTGPAMSDCDADPVQNMLGQVYRDSTGETARQRSGSRIIRLLRPGQVMTMEYDPSRINIILDDKGAIQALRCG
ncbi:MAG: I78 family peptidase inhibitor [Bordetella sp.]|uniref:I78 family peptidase inhibitor n=1 Tax=Bordetella sp. TaxID=28081 RepID=UPI003F7B8734